MLILASLAVAGGFLAAFIWAVRSGQYEDTRTPSMRILMDEEKLVSPASRSVAETNLAAAIPFSLARNSGRESAPALSDNSADSRPRLQG